MTTRHHCPGQLAMFDVLGPMAVRVTNGRRRYIYLSTTPISIALSQRQKTLKEELGPLARSYLRAAHDGWMGTTLADRICVKGLKQHPYALYGGDWEAGVPAA